MRARLTLVGLMFAGAIPVAGQGTGAITGQVRDGEHATPLVAARVILDGGPLVATTDGRGGYRLREVTAGWHKVTALFIGYRGLTRDSVLVRTGQTTPLDFELTASPIEIAPLSVTAPVDSLLDPLATADAQRYGAEDFRRLPISSVDEAIGLSAGAVGESYRGGRLGQQAFILDGLAVKNQLDASTGSLGLRIPPDMLTEAALVTNAFSARFGQAVSGLINLVTKDGGERWQGRAAYETDRPLGQGGDFGLDRVLLQADGPLFGRVRFAGAADASGRLDADPVNAPRPSDPRDPRAAEPWLLPHNSGEQLDLAGKFTVPIGSHQTFRLFGIHSAEQRLLYDPAYKYDPDLAPGRRVRGDLISAHVQRSFEPRSAVVDLRLAYFVREFIRGTLAQPVDYRFGAFTGKSLEIVGEDIAQRQDSAAARNPIPGLVLPELSENTVWGVPAFFNGRGSRGDLGWNNFHELRGQLDASLGAGKDGDIYAGVEVASQRVRTFQRTFGYLPVGDSVPPTTVADFSPFSGAAYTEVQVRGRELAVTGGLRYDRFDSRTTAVTLNRGSRQSLSPRVAVSTVLKGATLVVSYGRFSQAPDYQYLVDAAFDDSTRTGRFRRGNPALAYEKSTQYEFSLRVRPTPPTSLKVNIYVRRLEGLVASVPLGVDPDSTIFGNQDNGSVKGGEIVFTRETRGGWGVRVSYTLQQAQATSTSAFVLRRLIAIDPLTHDTIIPAKAEFPLDFDRRHGLTTIFTAQLSNSAGPRLLGVRPLAGFEAAVILRYASGLPFSHIDSTGTLVGPPNDRRLPSTSSLDLLIRRPVRLAGLRGGVYLDLRNLLNRRNQIAARTDNGQVTPDFLTLQNLADQAYLAHPEPIPFESPRYRAAADLDGNGYIDGATELKPLYLAAARDFTQPLFFYGAPRLVRIGMEVVF